MNTTDNVQGEVKRWINDKGYGFVKTENYGDVFISTKNLSSNQHITNGTLVSMSIIPSKVKKGEYQATKISVIENSNYLFAIVDWHNGKFGVVKNGADDYFIHRNDTPELLKERDFILFIPSISNGKKAASQVIKIDSKTNIKSIFNRILIAMHNSSWNIKLRLVRGMPIEGQIDIFKHYIDRYGATNEDILNYLKLGLTNELELPPFDIEFLIANIDIIQDEEIIKTLSDDIYKVFLENYITFIHNTLESSPQNENSFFKALSLLNDEDTFNKYKTEIRVFFRKMPFFASYSYSSNSRFGKKNIIEIVPNGLKDYLIKDYIEQGISDTELLPLLETWGWKDEYLPLFNRINKLFIEVYWDSSYKYNTTKKQILKFLPLDLQLQLIVDFINTNRVIDKEIYSMIAEWYSKINSKNEVIDIYIKEYQEFTTWYSLRDFENLETLDTQINSFKSWINKCSSSFFRDYFDLDTIQRVFPTAYAKFKMLEIALMYDNCYRSEEEDIKLYILQVFSETHLGKIYEIKKDTLKLTKHSYVSSQLSKISTKLTNFEFAEMLNNYCRLYREIDFSLDNIEFVDKVRAWVFRLSKDFNYNEFCYYFFMLNRLEQWMFSKKANALMGEEIKQSLLRQRVPWQLVSKKNDDIWIYEATWKSIWFEDKKIKILTNEENNFSKPFMWEFSEYKFNFLYDYIAGRRLETLVIEFDPTEMKIVSIENLDVLSEVLFKAEIQRLVEKDDKENLEKLLKGELIKIPIPINSVLRNECLIYLNKLQLSGLEPTRLLERTFSNNGLAVEQSFLYTIPLEKDDFAIIWESLEIDKAKATHIFKCKVEDYALIFSDIQSFLSAYTGVRSILNSKNELLERKANLGYYRKIDHDNFVFEKWKVKLHTVLPSLPIINEPVNA